MSVYFAYRSYDLGPTGKYLKRFEDDTVLGWFQRHWEHLAIEDRDEADDRLTTILGCDGWFLWNPFWLAAVEGMPPPKSAKALLTLIEQYVEEFVGAPHCLQVFTEEDGEGGALYYFDDHLLKKHGDRAAYLLHEDWRLPSGSDCCPFTPSVSTIALPSTSKAPGATYLAVLHRESKYPLDDLPVGYRIDGVRLPDLAQSLCRMPPDKKGPYLHAHLRCLPALMFAGIEPTDPVEAAFFRTAREDPEEVASWAAWSDWRQERGGESPGISLLRQAFARMARFPGRLQEQMPRTADLNAACHKLTELETKHQTDLRTAPRSLLHVEEHLAQMCLDVSHADEPYFSQWIFFDDLWASAHRDLANAILRFAARWDVLSADKR